MLQLNKENILSHTVLAVRNGESICNNTISKPIPDTDLCMVYVLPLDEEKSALLSHDVIEAHDVTLEELHAAAEKNTSKQECLFKSLGSILGEAEVPWNQPTVYVATTKEMRNGASVMLNTEFMMDIARQLKDDLYLIPSSISEILVAPKKDFAKEALEGMIRPINESCVRPHERLSDHLFQFTRRSRRIRFA